MPVRNRLVYLLATIALIAISLPARLTDWYPPFVVIYVADAVWALMVYLLAAAIFAQTKSLHILIGCLLLCYAVEFSQLYQADWINEVRHWPLMGLLLGYGFRVEDLIAYTLGIGLGFFLDRLYWLKLEAISEKSSVSS